MAKGEKLEAGKDYVRARLEFKNAIKVDPQCVDCYAGLARVELALKNFREAYAVYSMAVDLAPERMDLQLALGRLFLLGRSADKAEEKARFIISKEPDNQNAHILLAMALTIQKDKREEALDLLKNIRNDAPARPEGYILAAKILSSQGYILFCRPYSLFISSKKIGMVSWMWPKRWNHLPRTRLALTRYLHRFMSRGEKSIWQKRLGKKP
jgi:tetratricopeptide (TPR) repeat protein